MSDVHIMIQSPVKNWVGGFSLSSFFHLILLCIFMVYFWYTFGVFFDLRKPVLWPAGARSIFNPIEKDPQGVVRQECYSTLM